MKTLYVCLVVIIATVCARQTVLDRNKGTHLAWKTTFRRQSLKLEIVHALLNSPGGAEDAFYVGDYSMAIADGVSGKKVEGDSPKFGPFLLDYIKTAIKEKHYSQPVAILGEAFEKVHHDLIDGAATISFGMLRNRHFVIASLGNSGIAVLRPECDGNDQDDSDSDEFNDNVEDSDEIEYGGSSESASTKSRNRCSVDMLFRTESQFHELGVPYRLSTIDKHNKNVPGDAQTSSIRIHPGDLIIVGSDGLFDFLWDVDIINVLSKGMTQGSSLQSLADDMAKRARHAAESSSVFTPLQDQALREGKYLDSVADQDITILLARVVTNE